MEPIEDPDGVVADTRAQFVFLGSGFVPTTTMPEGLQQFARCQPFTSVTETLRGLLIGTPIGTNAIAAVAWSISLSLVCYFCAIHLHRNRQAK